VSTISDFSFAFYQKSTFNESLNGWNVSAATNMMAVFYGDTSFSQNLCAWGDALIATNAYNMLPSPWAASSAAASAGFGWSCR